MEILYNYIPYKHPKLGVFSITGDKWVDNPERGYGGWEVIEREEYIIGESDDSYTTKLVKHRICDTSAPNYNETVLLPLGIHKSRLIKWKTSPGDQLKLFD